MISLQKKEYPLFQSFRIHAPRWGAGMNDLSGSLAPRESLRSSLGYVLTTRWAVDSVPQGDMELSPGMSWAGCTVPQGDIDPSPGMSYAIPWVETPMKIQHPNGVRESVSRSY